MEVDVTLVVAVVRDQSGIDVPLAVERTADVNEAFVGIKTSVRSLDIEGSYGSFDSYEGLVDVGGPLNSQGNVYARLVTHYRDDKSYIDFHPDTKRLYVAPSLTWEVD